MAESKNDSNLILGISAYYHDSAAGLLRQGEIIAAAQQERFSRTKHDPSFPDKAIDYCLQEVGAGLEDLKYVVFYDKPLLKFERIVETHLAFAPRGIKSFVTSMPLWLKEKLFLKDLLKKELLKLDPSLRKQDLPPLLFSEHHESHAASAFYPSPFRRAAVLCVDGVGEWATTSAWTGEENRISPLWELSFPHSLGLLYSAFTYFTGFKVNSGEYKVMGLAPYGRPTYVKTIYDNLIELKPDGTFRLNMDFFNYCTGLTMTSRRFDRLFDGPRREPESLLTQRELDLARSIQEVTEEVMLRLARTLHRETRSENLCLAGGVALNCVANGRIQREGPFKEVWVQPAAGDAGGALGCALSAWHHVEEKPRGTLPDGDAMWGSYLGPSFSNEEVERFLQSKDCVYARLGEEECISRVADSLVLGKVIGWFQGRMEFGPRALGNRSIIADPRSEKMQSIVNQKIKHRESFRPFAPSVLRERVNEYFEMETDSPYMLMVAPVKASRRNPLTRKQHDLRGLDLLKVPRSDIPAVTHVDYSARIQTVHQNTNPRYHRLIRAFESRTGCGAVVNTSFNVRGEPIVCTPEDAYRCFMRTEMDVLVLGNCILDKRDQKPLRKGADQRGPFELD